ncbi:CDP-alcohol phosphatidyltransferase family protein [Albibacterium sp.]|uniref:CDP-alcohol phosphatidyltransferase family protein n=1 Tax=Albibacterium sp. TaxID=2952885 RepID=UPI002BD0C109|nr:CDP-alcohol phosphatidyltransferase family protein [Albibacterium sp.]HUH18459.1 CDP-alcohol phosphatidyltransferase family protein [Albibacterium sp.]
MTDLEVAERAKKKKLFKDRKRTNILSVPEQKFISFLVSRIPSYITPNKLTAIGLFGSLLVMLGFILAYYGSQFYLLLGVVGLFVNWFGDSLDGRIAYFRNIPRKWYGFSLDIIMDWVGTVLIGMGYFFYAKDGYEVFAFLFVVLYGWAMIISQLRYRITDVYTIDAGLMGPTEIRIIIAIMILIELAFFNTIHFFVAGICVILFIINIIDTRKLLKLGDERDIADRKAKELN